MASNAPPSVETSGAFAAAPVEDDAEPRLAQLQRLAGVDVATGVSSSCGGVVVTADAAWFRASNAQSLCVAAEVAGRTRAALLARLHVPGRGAAAGALNAATQRVLAAAPARLHLCCGGNAAWGMPGAALAVAAPCVESALAAMCCAALAGGDSGCVAAAAPALGAALRDALLGVSLQTGRSALCGGGGAPHVRVRDLHAAALLALSPAAGAPLASRALWAEALSHCLLSVPWGGPAALLRLCRAMVTHGDVAAALEDAAHGALRPRGFAAALQAWARSTLCAEAAAYQTGWLGGAGALSPAAAAYLAADPDAAVSWLDYSPPASRNGVRPATLRANLAWLATLMATEKPRDLAWCLAAVGFNAAWAIFAPLIISDIITIAPAIAAAAADGAPLEPLRLLHGGMMPDYTVYAGRNAANALAILAGAFGGGAAVSAHMNRQLSARSVGNPGFGLGARAALARRLAAAPGLLADTAGLAAAARAAQHDAHLVGAATSATFTAANALGQLALALALMFLINARMAGFFLATLPVTALLTGLQGRASGQLSATLKTRQEALEVAADAALLCAGAAAGSGTHDTAVAAAGAAAEAAADEISVAAAVLQQYVAIVSGGLTAFLLGLGGQQMAAGRLDVGLFVAFISAAGAAAPQVPALVEAVRAWRVAGRAAALLRGADAVRAPPAPALDGADSDKAPALLAAAPALAARGVAFAYARSPSRALVAASFDLPGGAKCVLVGRSGAGKTTLLRLLAGRYLPAQGALLADGAPLAAAARAAGPGGVAFAPAEPMLFAGSVAHNIAMGLPSAVIASLPDGGQARVAAAAKAAGLIGDGASVSLATRVGGAGALSSGQRQRIGIARALASQAPLLLLDEPTSNADGATAAALVAALVALGDGCTVVAATNAPALFESGGFSHGMCIAGATVAEAGPLDALVAARGAYARTAAAVGVACDASAPLAPAALRAALWPLAAASDAECALLAPLLAPRTLPAGTTLFAAGTAPAAAFVLARGRVELRSTPGSAPAVAVPVGACFQEGSLLDAAAVASRTAVATAADTVVLELRCAALAALAPLAPRLAASITALAAARDAAVTPAALRAAAWPLQRLDDEALTALAAASSIEVLQPGDALCVRGGACPGLAVVLAGQAAVTRRLLTGGETVTTITAGGAFGADSLVTAGQGGAEVEVQAAGAAPTVLLLLPHAALLPPALPPPACADDAAFARAAAELGAAAAAWRAAAGADALAAHWLLHAALPDAVQRASATSALAASALPLPLGAPAHLPSPRALGALIPVADVDIADDEASGTANAACPGDGAWAAVSELAPGAAATSPALLRAGPAALAALLSRDAFANAVGAEGLARAAAAAGALAAALSALRAAGVASGRAVALRRGEAAFAPLSADDAAVLLHGRLAPPYDDVATGTLLLRSQAAQAAMPTQLAAALGGGRVAEGTCGGDVGSVLLPAALGSRPAASGAPVLGGAAVLGGALTVQLPALSPGAEPASPVFAWLADGAPIARACKATYAPEPADVGRALAVRCRAAPWHDESVLAAVPAKVPLGEADATAARDAALAAVAARGCAAFACSVSAARGGAAASLEGEACVLELSAAGARLARPGAAAEQRSRLATLLFGDGSVTVASAAWGAPGLALCGARGDGDAPCGAYLQVHADCHVMLKFASPRERNGALAAARALAARRRKPLPAL
jgi:ABC-type multidrug transport system fused ATPase/permease subunit